MYGPRPVYKAREESWVTKQTVISDWDVSQRDQDSGLLCSTRCTTQ